MPEEQHQTTQGVPLKDLIAEKPDAERSAAERAYIHAWSLGAHLGLTHPLQLRALLKGVSDGLEASSQSEAAGRGAS